MLSNDDRMGRTTELRHVSNKYLIQLSNILNTLDSWKELMAAIPKRQISPTEFDESTTQTKYKYSEIKEIELASRSMKQQPTLILFDEWGTSGVVRPTLSHLLTLLVRLELYRAADFVAREMLKEQVPVRPGIGPAARVDITLIDESKKIAVAAKPSAVQNTLENQMQPDKVGPSVVQKVDAPPVQSLIKFTDNLKSNQNLDGPRHRNAIILNEPTVRPNSPSLKQDLSLRNIRPTELSQITDDLSIENYPKLDILNLGSQLHASSTSENNVSISNIPDLPGLLNRSTHNSMQNESNLSNMAIPKLAVLLETMSSSSAIVDDFEDNSRDINPPQDLPAHSFLGNSETTESMLNVPRNIGLSGYLEQSAMLPVVLNDSHGSAHEVRNSAALSQVNIPFLSALGPK